jgi:hypothetical protein
MHILFIFYFRFEKKPRQPGFQTPGYPDKRLQWRIRFPPNHELSLRFPVIIYVRSKYSSGKLSANAQFGVIGY